MKKTFKVLLFTVLGYVFVAIIFNLLPTDKPDFSKVFQPNYSFGNKQQGNEIVIIGYKDGKSTTTGQVEPFAKGPLEHVHTNFDELFSVSEGTLSLLVNGKKITISAGQSFTVPRGTYHKFFNETDKPVIVNGENPAGFLFILTQLYGVSRDNPQIFQSPKFMLQLSAWGSDFDSYLKDGPPPIVVKIYKFLLLPIAKLSGYKYSNPDYFPKPMSSLK